MSESAPETAPEPQGSAKENKAVRALRGAARTALAAAAIFTGGTVVQESLRQAERQRGPEGERAREGALSFENDLEYLRHVNSQLILLKSSKNPEERLPALLQIVDEFLAQFRLLLGHLSARDVKEIYRLYSREEIFIIRSTVDQILLSLEETGKIKEVKYYEYLRQLSGLLRKLEQPNDAGSPAIPLNA
jgi:hypothetical protein